MDAHQLKLSRDSAVVLVIDIQERMVAAMDKGELPAVERAAVALIKGAGILGVPVVVTEQYPKGLGRTTETVRSAFPDGTKVIEKICFSSAGSEQVMDWIKSMGRNQIILCGMETHVCVFQTARDLAMRGFSVFVAADAVLSRTRENKQVGLGLMKQAGAAVSSSEAVLFDLLERAGSSEFKMISSLVK